MIKVIKLFIFSTIFTSYMFALSLNKPSSFHIRAKLAKPGEYNITGTQTIADIGACSKVTISLSMDINGTNDDDGLGNDIVTCQLWDDNELKDETNISIPVGTTKYATFTLSFLGKYKTGVPGVGVYCNELGIQEDPFYPKDVKGTCDIQEVSVPLFGKFGLFIFISLVGLLGSFSLRNKS